MADNYTLDAIVYGSDDVGGVQYPYVKLVYGADGTATPVSGADPLPATGTFALTGTPEVAGTVAVASAPVGTIGQVTPGAGAAHLGKAEDAQHSSGDVGVMALSVRKDAAAALAGSDADYAPLITDDAGRLYVNVAKSVAVSSTTDNLGVAHMVDQAMSGTTALAPKKVGATFTAGTYSLVAAVADRQIVPTNIIVNTGTNALFTFMNGTAGASLSGTYSFGANGGMAPGYDPTGYFATDANTPLVGSVSAGTVAVTIGYLEVPA